MSAVTQKPFQSQISDGVGSQVQLSISPDQIGFFVGPKGKNIRNHIVAKSIGLYKEEKYILNNLFDKMPKGGIIVFGSLNSKDTPECTKALLKSIGLNHKICRFDFATKYSYLIKK